MVPRILIAGLGVALLLPAASKKAAGPSQTENDFVTISAKAVVDKNEIKQMLGSDLDGHYIVVDVTVTPKPGKEIDIQRDDFLLRTDKDGDKSHPFAPSQIAGKGVLVVSETGRGGGGMIGDAGGPVWGGYPGTMDRPRRLGGDGVGVGDAGDSGAAAAVKSGGAEKESPLMKTLQAKILPEKKTEDPVSGLLYFPLEKQKLKDLELTYVTQDGKLSLRFR